jgi:hypothetical protein
MTDFSDESKWKEVTLWGHQYYFQTWSKYSCQEVNNICLGGMKKAGEQGLVGCYLKFQSHSTPYEEFPDDPSVVVVGYRPLNDEEKQKITDQNIIEELAFEKGITIHEALQLQVLLAKGVCKL